MVRIRKNTTFRYVFTTKILAVSARLVLIIKIWPSCGSRDMNSLYFPRYRLRVQRSLTWASFPDMRWINLAKLSATSLLLLKSMYHNRKYPICRYFLIVLIQIGLILSQSSDTAHPTKIGFKKAVTKAKYHSEFSYWCQRVQKNKKWKSSHAGNRSY